MGGGVASSQPPPGSVPRMARIASARRSRWRRSSPAGLIPPLPPPRNVTRREESNDDSGDNEEEKVRAAPGQTSSVVATSTPADAERAARLSPDAQRTRSVPRLSLDPPAAVPPPTRPSSRVRVLRTAEELDDARTRAAEQMQRIAEAMGPVVRRAAGGAAKAVGAAAVPRVLTGAGTGDAGPAGPVAQGPDKAGAAAEGD